MRRVAQYVLYATIPVAIFLQFTHGPVVWEFVFACAAVIPIAAWIGLSTEQLAHRMGSTYGALFNATFGNFAELVIAIFAVRAGLPDVVRASFAGSVLGNLLFVAGLSMIAGGYNRPVLKFNALAAESQAGQLILAVAAVLVPALFFRMTHRDTLIHSVSIGTAVILIVVYALGLFFSFKTHADRMSAVGPPPEQPGHVWPLRRAILLLVAASALMAVVAEGLVEAVRQAGHAWG